MLSIKIPPIIRLGLRILPIIAGTVFFAAIILFSGFYLFLDHHRLAQWFMGINSCFYQNTTWSTEFFTPGIKSDGNMYAIIAIVISIAGLFHVQKWFQLRKIFSFNTADRLDIKHPLPVFICIVMAIASWVIGNHVAAPAYDEVFSAQNVAEIHPFQGIAYYMLPNNHLLFNLFNNVLFPFATDKVFTGRVLSLVTYIVFILAVFTYFRRWLQNPWLALLFSTTLSLQFFAWGFSFQARGYELYLLAEWGTFIATFGYLLSNDERWLHLQVACIVTGYFCMPSFLYFHGALILFMLLYQLLYRQRDLPFWKHQLYAVLVTFLCYLPTLCFSGVEAITANSYVQPMASAKTTALFWQNISPLLKTYFSHIFSGIGVGSTDLGIVLSLLPLTLLFARKNKPYALFGLLYLCLWFMFFVIAMTMKRLPFERNLIGHYSITLAGLLLVVFWLAGLLTRDQEKPLAQRISFSVVAALLIFHFARTNGTYLKDTLYEYDVNKNYDEQTKLLSTFPHGSTIAFSDIEFYSYYVCKKKGYTVSKCSDGNEDYYLKLQVEKSPSFLHSNYVLLSESNGMEVYKRK